MRNLWTLYVYELKKICKRKIVWIAVTIMFLMIVFMATGDTFTTMHTVAIGEETFTVSGLEYQAYRKENAERLNGQPIDDKLLEEVKAAYQRIHVTSYEEETYGHSSMSSMTAMESIFEDENPIDREELVKKREQYKEIYQYVYAVMGDYETIHTINETILYDKRFDKIQNNWTSQKLTEGERAFWMEREAAIDKPLIYGYAAGWERILEEFLSLNVILILTISICLSNTFAEEHLRKTDQLILCSKYGKKLHYYAKIAAGVTFGMCCGALFLAFDILLALLVYGAGGFDAAVQVYAPICSWKLTMGQAVFMMGAVYLVAAMFLSIFTMFLSEAINNSVAVMGLMTGGMMVSLLVGVPYRFRTLSQVYELLPTVLLRVWQLWDNRLVNVLGVYFTNFQIAPIIYMILSAVLIIWGNYLYKNYQVSGR